LQRSDVLQTLRPLRGGRGAQSIKPWRRALLLDDDQDETPRWKVGSAREPDAHPPDGRERGLSKIWCDTHEKNAYSSVPSAERICPRRQAVGPPYRSWLILVLV